MGQNSTVEWGMAWKTKYGGQITTVPMKILMYREEARAGEESVYISAHALLRHKPFSGFKGTILAV